MKALLPLGGLAGGLLVGFALFNSFKWQVPAEYAPYLSVAALAGIDTVFGGIRAGVEARRRRFQNDVFASGFILNHTPDAQKNELKPWLKQCWCIPPAHNAAFVCAMEDVLDVYARPFDPKRPLVCLDEGSKQLLEDSRPSLPMQAGQPVREDYEYIRHGTCSFFMRRFYLNKLAMARKRVQEDNAAAFASLSLPTGPLG